MHLSDDTCSSPHVNHVPIHTSRINEVMGFFLFVSFSPSCALDQLLLASAILLQHMLDVSVHMFLKPIP